MRYIILLLFAIFLIFSIDFATQNTINVPINYKVEWLKFNFVTEKQVFVPIFFSFAFGIMFSVFYFFVSHAFLLKKLRQNRKEIKKLEKNLEEEKSKNNSFYSNKEIENDANDTINKNDFHEDGESIDLENDGSYNYKK